MAIAIVPGTIHHETKRPENAGRAAVNAVE